MESSHAAAANRRDIGMERAEDKANADHIGWSEDAEAAVRAYAAEHRGRRFLAEDVRAWAEARKLVAPPVNGRAWGGVIQRCARLNVIRRAGYAPAKSSNLSPKCEWEAV